MSASTADAAAATAANGTPLKRKKMAPNQPPSKRTKVAEAEAEVKPVESVSAPAEPAIAAAEDDNAPPPCGQPELDVVQTDGFVGLQNSDHPNGEAVNPYDEANAIIRDFTRASTARTKTNWYEDYLYSEWLSVVAAVSEHDGKKIDTLKLEHNNTDLNFAAIQSPIGVLSDCTVNGYDGTRLDTGKFKPTKLENIKQGVTWKALAYHTLGADKEDPLHDAEALKFVKWMEGFCSWFLDQTTGDLMKKTAMEPFVRRSKDLLATLGVNKPKPEDVKRMMASQFLRLMRKNKQEIFCGSFKTRLLREPFKKEKEEINNGTHTHVAATPWLQEVYNTSKSKLMLKEVKVYVPHPPEYIEKHWPCPVFKEINRSEVNIQNGDLGAVIFTPGATTEAGDKFSLMGYLTGIIWYSAPTSLSIPRYNFDPTEFSKYETLQKPPRLFGATTDYFASRKPVLALPPAEPDSSSSSSSSSSSIPTIEGSVLNNESVFLLAFLKGTFKNDKDFTVDSALAALQGADKAPHAVVNNIKEHIDGLASQGFLYCSDEGVFRVV